MRFSFASVALLALAHLLAPGVHGAPAVLSDHTNSLAVRQVPNPINDLLDSVIGALQGLLGNAVPIPSALAEQLAQIAQELQKTAASGILPRASSSSESTSPATHLPTTTTHVLTVSTGRIAKSTVSSASTSQATSTPQARIRRQLPSALPTSVLSAVLSISHTASLPVESIIASTASIAHSKSAAPQAAAIKPTPSKH